MHPIEFVPLSDIEPQKIIDLMNDERVGRYLPLLSGAFTAEACETFLDAKRQMWAEHGYGPHAFIINGEFAGWGGLQPENGEADFALVLHPDFWGWGYRVFQKIKAEALKEGRISSITILLPPQRTNYRAVKRLGFVEDGGLVIDGAVFLRFRLVLG